MVRFVVAPRAEGAPQRDLLGEGPVWDGATGTLTWVDIAGGRVNRLQAASGEVRVWDAGGHASAALPCRSGALLLARPDGLFRLDLASGAIRAFARPDPDPSNRANECRVDPGGRLWLGTMSNNLSPDGSPRPLAGVTGGLFRIDGAGRATRMLGGIGIANTLAWSPDGARLYFADSLAGVIWRFRFDAQTGLLHDREVFAGPDAAPGAPDGSAVDEEGCLWNARWGAGCLVRFAPDGRVDRRVELPVSQPTCPAFGGPDLKTLFVTSARVELEGLAPDSLDGALFAATVEVAGLATPPFADA